MKFQDFEVAVAELPEELDEDPLDDEPELEPEDELPLDDEPELEDPLDDEPELDEPEDELPLDDEPELDEPPIVCSVTFKLLFVANVVV